MDNSYLYLDQTTLDQLASQTFYERQVWFASGQEYTLQPGRWRAGNMNVYGDNQNGPSFQRRSFSSTGQTTQWFLNCSPVFTIQSTINHFFSNSFPIYKLLCTTPGILFWRPEVIPTMSPKFYTEQAYLVQNNTSYDISYPMPGNIDVLYKTRDDVTTDAKGSVEHLIYRGPQVTQFPRLDGNFPGSVSPITIILNSTI